MSSRVALMTPTNNDDVALQLPEGLYWTGDRETHIHETPSIPSASSPSRLLRRQQNRDKCAKAGPDRFIFEYCAADDSFMKTLAGEGCQVEQVTEHHDARTQAGLAHAQYECRKA